MRGSRLHEPAGRPPRRGARSRDLPGERGDGIVHELGSLVVGAVARLDPLHADVGGAGRQQALGAAHGVVQGVEAPLQHHHGLGELVDKIVDGARGRQVCPALKHPQGPRVTARPEDLLRQPLIRHVGVLGVTPLEDLANIALKVQQQPPPRQLNQHPRRLAILAHGVPALRQHIVRVDLPRAVHEHETLHEFWVVACQAGAHESPDGVAAHHHGAAHDLGHEGAQELRPAVLAVAAADLLGAPEAGEGGGVYPEPAGGKAVDVVTEVLRESPKSVHQQHRLAVLRPRHGVAGEEPLPRPVARRGAARPLARGVDARDVAVEAQLIDPLTCRRVGVPRSEAEVLEEPPGRPGHIHGRRHPAGGDLAEEEGVAEESVEGSSGVVLPCLGIRGGRSQPPRKVLLHPPRHVSLCHRLRAPLAPHPEVEHIPGLQAHGKRRDRDRRAHRRERSPAALHEAAVVLLREPPLPLLRRPQGQAPAPQRHAGREGALHRLQGRAGRVLDLVLRHNLGCPSLGGDDGDHLGRVATSHD
mmetsp:Transcript_27396/g.87796  ORF Transcript_27396/g.87796 Transcript_27396/m.87796 type:complete len:529 (-) Transcript_27396:450-2036(-)